MFVVIIVTSLVTVFLFIFTTAFYLIALFSDESDDTPELLSIDAHEFRSSPPASPVAREPDKLEKGADNNRQINGEETDCIIYNSTNVSNSLTNENKQDSGSSSNQKLGNEQSDDSNEDTTSTEHTNVWHASIAAQKALISNQLGQASSKQLFDDFDTKETDFGGTALHWCKTRKSLDKLLKLGLPIEAVNQRRETALHVAVRRRKLQILVGLLCHEANVESRNEDGETPLIVACKTSNIFACQLLLVFDADVNACDNVGVSARHYSASICHRHKNPQQPDAARLILAMLEAMSASRCPPRKVINEDDTNTLQCSDGCSHDGSYNGDSFKRWPDLMKESLYKRYMFNGLVQEWRKCAKESGASRLLCIDGGGLRGVIVCQIMIEMEKYLQRPLISYFDWIGGTSVGGFVGCGLGLGISLKKLRRICFDVKDEVFSGNKPYNSSFLERALKRTFGTTKRMSDIKGKHVAVTTVIADRDPCQLRLFRNYASPQVLLERHEIPVDVFNNMSGHSIMRHRDLVSSKSTISVDESKITSKKSEQDLARAMKSLKLDKDEANVGEKVLEESDQDPLVWQAVRASTAAPFFFKPYGPYLDGGIISNNPTLDMLGEFYTYHSVRKFVKKVRSDSQLSDYCPNKLDLVVSLGTGRSRVVSQQAMVDFGQVASGFSTVFSPVELLRSIRAARDLFKKLLHQSCQTEDHILDRAQAWCSSLEIPYYRINPPLASIFSIDDKRDEQLVNALWQTKLYMRSMKDQLQELSEILDKTSKRCHCDRL